MKSITTKQQKHKANEIYIYIVIQIEEYKIDY